MPTGMYTNAYQRFFGGDIDFINDTVAAILIDTTQYQVDFENDVDISDIPDEAILSEIDVTGKYIDDLSLHSDNLVFGYVETGSSIGGAIVLYVNAADTNNSFLLFHIDGFTPVINTSVSFIWPPAGILTAVIN